jgi:DedD protein
MDRRVKERLVGATILVVLIVLIVPELLSGPKRGPANQWAAPPPPVAAAPEEPVGRPPVRTVTVDLLVGKATQDADTSAASSVAVPPPADIPPATLTTAGEEGHPVPEQAASDESASSADAAHARPEAPPTVTTLKAQPAAPSALENEVSPPRSAAPTPRPSTAREPVRHGWAVQLGSFASRTNAETLVHRLKAHDSVYVSSSGNGAALRYRVRVGPLADRGAAERVRLKLMKEGYSASLVPP